MKSKKWYRYRAGNTNDYRVLLSEEEARVGCFEECGEDVEELPKWIKPAYVWLCELTDGKPRRRKVIVHKDAHEQLKRGEPIMFRGMQMRLTGWYGEYRRVPKHLRK